MTTEVYYWHMAGGFSSELLEEHRDAIHLLLSGTYNTADLEKLHGCNVYSFRLNKKDRLLFTEKKVDGKNILIVLDVIPHTYHKNKFVKNPKFLESLKDNFDITLPEEPVFEAVTEKPSFTTDTNIKIQFQRIHYFNHKLIKFDTEQEKALSIDLPALISGPAGSGKSCVANSLLVQLANTDTSGKEIVYIAESEELVRSVEKQWNETPKAESETAHKRVAFKTYLQLLREHAPDALAGKTLATKETCEQWHRAYLEKCKNIAKATQRNAKHRINVSDFENVNKLYGEFRIISGCIAFAEMSGLKAVDLYGKLGKYESNFPAEIRDEAFKAYENYSAYLKQEKIFDPAFIQINLKDLYAGIVCDESQDLSHMQLIQLIKIATNRKTCFCLDSHQRLKDTISQRPFILKLVGNENHIMLPCCYRLPPKIAKCVESVIEIKNRLSGGTADKYEKVISTTSTHHETAGRVYWVDPNGRTVKATEYLKKLNTHASFAVITRQENVEQAKKRYDTAAVFTTEQAKGLEFDYVIADNLLDDEAFRKASRVLPKTGQVKETRAADSDFTYDTDFNDLIVAFSRTKVELIISQSEKGISAIKESFKNLDDPKKLGDDTVKESTQEEWLAFIKTLVVKKQLLQAKELYIKNKLGTDAEFEAYKNKVESESSATKPVSATAENLPPVEPASTTPPPADLPSTPKQPVGNNTNNVVKDEQKKDVALAKKDEKPDLKKSKTQKVKEYFEMILSPACKPAMLTSLLLDEKAFEYLFVKIVKDNKNLFELLFEDDKKFKDFWSLLFSLSTKHEKVKSIIRRAVESPVIKDDKKTKFELLGYLFLDANHTKQLLSICTHSLTNIPQERLVKIIMDAKKGSNIIFNIFSYYTPEELAQTSRILFADNKALNEDLKEILFMYVLTQGQPFSPLIVLMRSWDVLNEIITANPTLIKLPPLFTTSDFLLRIFSTQTASSRVAAHAVLRKWLLNNPELLPFLGHKDLNGSPNSLVLALINKNYDDIKNFPENLLNEKNGLGDTALHLAIRFGDKVAVELLLNRDKIDVNRQRYVISGYDGYTPLMVACALGETAIVKILLEHKDIHPNTKPNDDVFVSALSLAFDNKIPEIIELLLQHPLTVASLSDQANYRSKILYPYLKSEAERTNLRNIIQIYTRHRLTRPQEKHFLYQSEKTKVLEVNSSVTIPAENIVLFPGIDKTNLRPILQQLGIKTLNLLECAIVVNDVELVKFLINDCKFFLISNVARKLANKIKPKRDEQILELLKPRDSKELSTQEILSSVINPKGEIIAGADVNIEDHLGRRPLHHCILTNNKQAFDLLIACEDIAINAMDDEKNPPLLVAINNCNLYMAQRLCDHKDLEIGVYGEQYLVLAIRAFKRNKTDDQYKIIQVLRFDNLCKKNIDLVLLIAAGEVEYTRRLVIQKTNQLESSSSLFKNSIEFKGTFGKFARFNDYFKIMNTKLEKFCEEFDISSLTMFHVAAIYGNVDMIKMLHEQKLDLKPCNDVHAWQFAEFFGHTEAANLLKALAQPVKMLQKN